MLHRGGYRAPSFTLQPRDRCPKSVPFFAQYGGQWMRYLRSAPLTAQKITNMREKGTIKRYLPERGFGFIETDGGGADLFLHVSELRPEVPQRSEERRVGKEGRSR